MATIHDVDVPRLSGSIVRSADPAGLEYQLQRVLHEGAHSVTFLAKVQAEGGPDVVIKVLRPRALRELGPAAAAFDKEIEALRRLSSRSPAPEHVVRFLDFGSVRVGECPLALPWVAVECVSGGAEGGTLRARVENCIAASGFGFDRARARNAVACVVSGLQAIHAIGVIHRDVTPNNVLASGSASTEIFKIADFGLARVSSAATFGNVLLGTPGYCAPEQSFPEKVGPGTYSDVFGLACSTYFLLTGASYFRARSIPETLVAVHGSARRSILEADTLTPSLRDRAQICRKIDDVLALATRPEPAARPQTVEELAEALVPLLD